MDKAGERKTGSVGPALPGKRARDEREPLSEYTSGNSGDPDLYGGPEIDWNSRLDGREGGA